MVLGKLVNHSGPLSFVLLFHMENKRYSKNFFKLWLEKYQRTRKPIPNFTDEDSKAEKYTQSQAIRLKAF